MFPGNGTSKTMLVQTMYLTHFTAPCSNEVFHRNLSIGSENSSFQIKIDFGTNVRFVDNIFTSDSMF